MTLENGLVTELTAVIGSQRKALDITGVSRGTWQYRQQPRERVRKPIPQALRAYPSRISQADRDEIAGWILKGWAQHESVDHSFASAWDDGILLASRRTWWRVAAELDQFLRPKTSKKKQSSFPREKPVVVATGPGQAWSWDITDLHSPWIGKKFKAYKIIDIYSREIVGYRVENREADHLAVEMFHQAIVERGAPKVVHADSGSAMRSNQLKEFLTRHGTELSHNRPYVSNDNPFSEAGFKTMKYRPNFPRVFETLEAARAYVDEYVVWYNTKHKHSGIALFSPQQVGDGSWEQVWEVRDQALQAYYERHPERFRGRPSTPMPSEAVGINLS